MQTREELNEIVIRKANTARNWVEVKINKYITTRFFSKLGADVTIIPACQHTKEMGWIHPTTDKVRNGSNNCLDVKGASMTNSREHTIITDIYIHGGMVESLLRGHSSHRPRLHHIQLRW